MPKYIYHCVKCSKEIVQERSYEIPYESDKEPAPICSSCEIEMARSWNDTPVIFKGKGFYKNDNKS